MEILLEIIFQFVVEFLVEVVGSLIFDSLFHGLSRVPWVRKSFNVLTAVTLFLVLGIITGFMSLLILPVAISRSSSLPGISLLVTPTLVGLAMALVGWLRRRKGKIVTQLESFAYGFLFAFGMALIRFYFAD